MNDIVLFFSSKTELSSLTMKIINHLIRESDKFAKPVSLTVYSEVKIFMEDMGIATGEIEDFAAQANTELAESGHKLELFSGPGRYVNGRFDSRMFHENKKYCTFWLAERLKVHEAKNTEMSAGMLE